MKHDKDLTMRDLKHCHEKKPSMFYTDSGVMLLAFVIGLLSCGIFIFPN